MRTEPIVFYGINNNQLPQDSYSRAVVGAQLHAHMLWPSNTDKRDLDIRVSVAMIANGMRERFMNLMEGGRREEAAELLSNLEKLTELQPRSQDAVLFPNAIAGSEAALSALGTAGSVAHILLAMKQAGVSKEINSARKAAKFLDKEVRKNPLMHDRAVNKGHSAIMRAYREYFRVIHIWLAAMVLKHGGPTLADVFVGQLDQLLALSRSLARELLEFAPDDPFQWIIAGALELPTPVQVDWPLEASIIEMVPKYRGDAINGSRLID